MYTRKLNVIYIQNPEETEAAMRSRMEDRHLWVLEGMNEAMEFHELPFRFSEGALIKESSEYWIDAQLECGDVLNGVCQDLANSHGRQTDNLELWLCVFKTQYFTPCAGIAKVGGNLALIGEQALFIDEKIGVFHELGHNLGCGHQSEYCPADVAEFLAVNHRLYKTLMGGGGGCNEFYDWQAEGIERIRALVFTDPEHPYCENGVCQSLGDEEFDCVSKIRSKWDQRLSKWTPECGSDDRNAVARPYCLVAEDMTCTESSRIGSSGAFPTTEDCSSHVRENPENCPSGIFFYKSNKKTCICCESEEMISAESKKVYRNQDLVVTEEPQSFALLNFQEPVMNLMAVIGGISTLYWLGNQMFCTQEIYKTVPDIQDV